MWMYKWQTLLVSCLVLCDTSSSAVRAHPVKHLVVLMMENRSFDHLLGWLHATKPEIDGLDGSEFNVNPKNGEKIYVNQKAEDQCIDDPLHLFRYVTKQVYGFDKPASDKDSQPKMSGFTATSVGIGLNAENPLSMFTPETAPIINTLAQEFTVFDKWFCAIPGPTDPNRAMAMSGTSGGDVHNFNGTLWKQQSYFDFLRQHGKTWKAYYQDDPWAFMYFEDMKKNPANHRNIHEIDQFFKDVENGDLPQFTWLQPRMTSHRGHPTWQHPDASIREGERLIKQVYETLRGSKYWNEVAFVLTYDEHGGFFDHVSPPQTGIPAPDHNRNPQGFEFERLGVRVPTLLISPWSRKGNVVGDPASGTAPTETSHFDGTSTIATANKLFGITTEISARASWAATFDGILTELKEPRTDCPLKLPELPEPSDEMLEKQHRLPLNDHLEIQIQYYCKFNHRGPSCGKGITNQLEASVFIEHEVAYFMDNLAREIEEADFEVAVN